MQAEQFYLQAFFNAMATWRIFTVLPSIRSLLFDVLRSLREVTALVILLVVRAGKGVGHFSPGSLNSSFVDFIRRPSLGLGPHYPSLQLRPVHAMYPSRAVKCPRNVPSVCCLLLQLVTYEFAVLGLWVYGGVLSNYLLYTKQEGSNANFDTISESLLSMFQVCMCVCVLPEARALSLDLEAPLPALADTWPRHDRAWAPHASGHLVGSALFLVFFICAGMQILVKDNWGSTMSLVISATGSVSSSVFFIAFVILASIMFTNLFIGIVCAVFVRNAKISNKCVGRVRVPEGSQGPCPVLPFPSLPFPSMRTQFDALLTGACSESMSAFQSARV